MKIQFKQIFCDTNITPINNSSLNISNSRFSSNRFSENRKSDLIFSNEKNLDIIRVVNLKNFISQKIKTKIENISIFSNQYNNDSENNYGLSDNIEVSKLLNNKLLNTTNNYMSITSTLNTMNSGQKDNLPLFYYKINNDYPVCKIIIEYFVKNIDKILLEVSINCSIYLIKYIIKKRIDIPESEQILIDSISQKKFKNEELLLNILIPNEIIGLNSLCNSRYFYSNSTKIKDESIRATNNSNFENSNIFTNKTLRFQLIHKGPKKCLIGLDFSFNLMKNINKIDFSIEAPSFREASDGLNFFCYCRNANCPILNNMFVKNLGYGKFELMREIAFLNCPKCIENKIDCKNIGFIKCEWSYRGILLNKKNCYISGDGVTIDDKLYILNEIILNQHIDKIEISIIEKRLRKINNELYMSSISSADSNEYDRELDSIGLISNKSNSSNIKNQSINNNDLNLIEKANENIEQEMTKIGKKSEFNSCSENYFGQIFNKNSNLNDNYNFEHDRNFKNEIGSVWRENEMINYEKNNQYKNTEIKIEYNSRQVSNYCMSILSTKSSEEKLKICIIF